MWDLIKEIKKDKIIILTTHYMDEAEYLGDRIAIMAEGSIVCCGSSSFLKNNFGGGHKLDLHFNNKVEDDVIEDLLKDYKFTICESNKTKICLELQKEQENDLSDLFQRLDSDNCKIQTGLLSYSLSDSSLEDVFLNVSKINNPKNKVEFDLHYVPIDYNRKVFWSI